MLCNFLSEENIKDYYYVSLYYGILLVKFFGPCSITPCRTAIDQISYFLNKYKTLRFGNEETIELEHLEQKKFSKTDYI